MLRIEIDGDWGIRDFAGVFYDLDSTAKYLLGKEVVGAAPKFYVLDNSVAWHNDMPVAPSELTVKELQFHSPGFIDLAGNEKVLGLVLGFVIWSIKYWSERNMRRLSEERSSLENEQLRREINERFTVDKSPSPGHLNSLAGGELMRTIADGRTKSARMIEVEKVD